MAAPMAIQLYLQKLMREEGAGHILMGVTPNVRDACDILYLRCGVCCEHNTINLDIRRNQNEVLDVLVPFVVDFSKSHSHRKPILGEWPTTPRIAAVAAGRKFREEANAEA